MNYKRSRTLLIWLSGIIFFIMSLLAMGYIYEPIAEKSVSQAYPPPGITVDIGGYKLHLNCIGEGSPTVIIDAGLGDWSSSWKDVQENVAKVTKICTYDRAGLGWSDAGPKPRNAKQFSKELHTLLKNAHIPGPYVLAGHSSGGFTARVYAHEYPREISGVVLIDSMSPKQFSSKALSSHETKTSKGTSLLTHFARFGIVRAVTSLLGLVENASDDEKASYAMQGSPKFVQAFIDENEGVQESARQAYEVNTLGNIPLIVLSRGIDDTENRSWSSMQKGLLQLSKNHDQITAQSSGHYIQLDQPNTVVDAINKVVHKVRIVH